MSLYQSRPASPDRVSGPDGAVGRSAYPGTREKGDTMRNCFIALALVGLLVMPAVAQEHYELVVGPPGRDPWPADGSQWHGLAPIGIHCTIANQDGHEDNGDGVVNKCDHITLNGTRYHITWAGPTYHLMWIGGTMYPWNDGGAEPSDPADPDAWHWIYPPEAYCQWQSVDDWEDTGEVPGVIDACDNVYIGGAWWHVEEVSLNIEVVEDPSPIERGTWTEIKNFFKNLF